MNTLTTILAPLALFISLAMASKAYGGLDNETQNFKTLVAVHGALMAFCFAILFPLGATLLQLLKRQSVVWFHGIWQIITLLIALVGFGIGIYMVHHTRSNVSLWKSFNGHPVIGTIVMALLIIQPLSGVIHHSIYKKRTCSISSPVYVADDSINHTTLTTSPRYTASTTPIGLAHRWLGRLLLVFGAINGGLGFQLSKESSVPIIVYGVLCVIFFALWAFALIKKGRTNNVTRGRHMGSTAMTSAMG